MYFTTFNAGKPTEFSIIHINEPKQYADDLATYEPCVQVTQKPTLEQAKFIFAFVKAASLCGGISNATTLKL